MTKKFVLENKSDQPLLYRIRKSGSFDSRNVSIPSGSIGVVRAWARKEIEFVFCPRLAGLFRETILVQNAADSTQNEEIVLKADVQRVATFAVVPGSGCLHFGSVAPGRSSAPHRVVVPNLSTKTRRFEVALKDRQAAAGYAVFTRCLHLSCLCCYCCFRFGADVQFFSSLYAVGIVLCLQ